MKGPKRNDKRVETKPDPRQRPLFETWVPAARAEHEAPVEPLRRIEAAGDRAG